MKAPPNFRKGEEQKGIRSNEQTKKDTPIQFRGEKGISSTTTQSLTAEAPAVFAGAKWEPMRRLSFSGSHHPVSQTNGHIGG